jgi:RNA polymerase sigma factor (sigma-70 family)
MTTAKHKTIHFIDRERRGGRHRYIDDDNDPVFEVIDGAALPDETLIALERDLEIEMALSRLKEPCLRLLTMLYLEDGEFSYADIAEELQIPLGSVGPTRARCLEKLMKLMPGSASNVFSRPSK